MPRRVTVTFADGSSHVYENTPDDVTPQQIVDRATREFSKPVKKLDGGRGMLERGARAVADTVSGAVGAIDNAMQPLREAVGYDPDEQNRKTDELARQIRERQRADLAKQDGILDTAGDLFTRGMAGASAGIERVASGLALNDAERQRFVTRARENEAIAKTGIAGETTWDAATGNLAKMPGFILEKGIESLPYMATAAVGPFGALSNAAATSGQIAQSRAEADGRQDASGKDVAIAAPFGTVSTLIDSLSLGAMRNGIGGGLARGIMRDAATEGLTEAVQSGIEYTGGAVGTKQGFDLGEMGSQMLQGGLVGAGVGGGFGVVTEGTKATFDAAGRITSRRADDTRTPGPGIREQAIADATILTPEDLASPLDNADIAAGRVEIAGATADKAADNALTQAGLPKVGSRVNVSNLPGGNALTGTIEDVFTDETGTGVVVRPEGGGKAMREYLDTLNELGVSITPSDPLAEADAIDAALAAQASAPMEVSSPLPSAGAETPSPRPSGRTPSASAGGGVNSAIVEGLKKRGFSEGQALGIAAGIHAESASNPNAKNPTSGAMGLGQWLGPRKDAIRKRFGDNPTLDQQLDFLADELRGGDAGGKYVLAENDPAKVLDAYVRKFMRPAAGAETDGDIARGMAALGQAPTDTGPLVPESTTQFADRPQQETPSVEVTAPAPDLPSAQQQTSEQNTAGPQDGEIAPTVEAPKAGGSMPTAADSVASAGGAVTYDADPALDYNSTPRAERIKIMKAAGIGSSMLAGGPERNSATEFDRLPAMVQQRIADYLRKNGNPAVPFEQDPEGGTTPPARVEETGTGKSVAVIGASEAELAAISAAVPKAMGMKRKDGALVYSKKYADKIRAALAGVTETVTPKSDAKGEGMSKDEIVRRRAELLGRAPMAVDEEFADMIAAKDYEGLRGILRPDNQKSRAVFAEATGITLPKTQRDTFAALREWAGVSEEQEAQRQKAEDDRIKRESDARDREWATNAAESTKMRDENGVETTVRQWIDSKIEQGFDRIENVSTGAVPKWVLLNPQGKGFNLQKDFLRYARVALEGRTPKKLTDEQIAQEEGMSVEDVRASKYLFANGSERIKLAREEGKAAFDRGDERVLPSYLSDMPAGVKEEWYAGWDQANLAKPVSKQVGATDSEAPEHAAVGVDERELSQIVNEFNSAQASMVEGDFKVTHVFDAPAKNEIVRLGEKVKVYNQQYGWMTPEEAKAKIAQWKEHARAQGGPGSVNGDKVVLSLFDLSGEWSRPWEEAGYQVYRFDIQADPEVGDVFNFSTDFFGDWFGDFDGQDIYAILAACPCTDFASSGARHFAAKDKDGRTVASVKLVHQTLATIEYFKPAVWAIENPVGRIEKLGGLPPWRLSFDPNHMGETYTKKTLLWGRFNGDLPIAPVDPVEGSKMWSQYGGKSIATKNARSVTPEGFAYSFFMANNAVDHPAMALANKFDRLDRVAIEKALKAGVKASEIENAVEDFYYQELDDESANAAIRDLTEQRRREKMGARPVDRSAAIIMDPAAGTVKTVPLGGKRTTDKKANPYVKTGERYTLKQDVEYLKAGGTYVVESTTRTDAFFRNVETGGRTSVKNYMLQPALQNGVMVAADSEETGDNVGPTPSALEDEVLAIDNDTYRRYLEALRPPSPSNRNAITSRAAQIQHQFNTKGEAAMRAALAEVSQPDLRVPEGFSVDPVQPVRGAADARIMGGRYSVVATRKSPFKSEKGYGNTPEEAKRDALRRVGAYDAIALQTWQEDFDAAGKRMRERLDKVDPEGLRPLLEAMAERGMRLPDGDFIETTNPHRAIELGYVEMTVDENGNRVGQITQAGRDFVSGRKAAPTPSANRLVTDERAAELRERLKAKLNPGRLNSGIDPEIIAIGTELAVYHIEKGARRFQAFAKAIADDLGMKVQDLRLYMRGWYNGARDMMEDAGESVAGMDTPDEVAKSMRTLEQWANEPAVTEGQNAATGAVDAELPNRVPASNAGASPGDVQRTSSVGRDGRAPQQEGGRGPGDVSRTDGGRTDTAGQRSAGGPADGARGDRTGVRDADNLPASERDAGSPRKAVAAVKGTDWVIEPGSLEEGRSLAQKARDNVEAIALVKQIEREGRSATREEQAVIARYIGWGGLKNIFPDPATGEYGKGFETLGPRLRELLTDEEYATARQSIQYAHYTSESVVRPMWDIARQLGFKGGVVFEPGMGTGNFRGMMPADIAAASSYSGLEYDHLTASIAKLLYPQSGVQQADYTRVPGIKNAVDLVIGNPPFSETAIAADPDYAKHKFLLHDFFFAKSLDALKPGGLLMFITSAGTMNKVGDKARQYLADRADLVGAIRLPGNAFEQNAGTSVTTDIVILRKRLPGEKPGDMAWVGTEPVSLPDRDGNTVQGNVNRYFVQNPDMVLGEQGMFDKLVAGPRYAVRAPKGFNIEQAIRNAGEKLPGSLVNTAPPAMAPGFIAPDIDLGSGERKDGSYYLDPDGRLMQFRGGAGRPVQAPGKGVTGGMSAAAQERVRGLIPVKDALRDVYAADIKADAAAGSVAREKLNKAYDAFVKKFGPINKTDISYRRPSRVELEGLRAEAREEARLAGTEWDDGSFDVQPLLDAGAKLTEIAKAREEAREKALAAGRIWNEGTFDPNEVPDKVIEKRPNLDPFMEDDEAYRLAAIEHYNKDSGEASKGRAFFENAITLDQTPKINSANDALLYSLNRLGRPDLRTIAEMSGKSETAVLEELGERLFEVPGKPGVYETGEMYLSGNVREKLATARVEAERDPAYQRNVRALEAALPAPLTPTEIAANLGMPWLPTKVIQQFATEKLGLRQANVSYLGKLAQWMATGDTSSAAARTEWGTERMDALKILEAALNRQTPVIRDKIETAQGEKTVVNEVATQAVQDKMAEMKAAFREWVWTDPDRSAALVDLYNREYNSLVAPKFDGSYLTTPGIASGWSWRPHQRAVIARIIQSGNTYMAHEVGAGKTSAMIGSGMEMKRLGLVSKPMYVVPNHMLGQFTKEFYEQYPLARILVADEQRFHTSRRKEFIARMAAEDWDAIIITHSAFGFIPMSDDFTAGMIQQQIDDLEDLIREIGKGQDVRITRRKVEQQKEALSQRLAGLTNRKRDQVFTFEETGVDFLFVDEAHLFRKLDFATKMGNVKGIDPAGSQMSFDLYAKTRYLEDKRPARNLVLASGTPITNTMAELFSVSRYLQQNELEKRGLGHFDAWAGAFGDTVTALEQDAAGGYKPVTRFAQFVNVPELSVMVRQVMDVVGATELRQYVSLPNLKGGSRNLITVEMTPMQESYKATLQSRMEAIKSRSGPPKKGDDILLSVIGDGRKAAIDYRLIDASAPKEPGSKLERMIEEVARRHKEFTRTPFHKPLPAGKGFSEKPETYGPATQMIFSDFGINGDFPVHKYIKSALIERGIPSGQIALIQDFKTHIAKQRLFNDMNEGKVRVLIGSVAKMGTGVNAQKRLRALHNMDAQWYPANDTQRNGRIIRQGNMNPEVEILDYATNGTYDSTMWGLMAKKARFIEGFMRGDPTMRDMEDLGEASQYEQASAMTTSDPRIMELTEWKQDLEKIERRQMAHEREQQSVRMRLSSARNEVVEAERLIPLIEQDIAKRVLQEGDEFSAAVKGETFDDRTEYGAALMTAMDALVEKSNGKEAREGVGEFGGFPLVAEVYPRAGGEMALSFYIKRAGGRESRVDMGTDARGLVTRLTNTLKAFDKDLSYAQNLKAAAEQRIADFEPKLGATFDDGGKGADLRQKINALESTLKAESDAAEEARKQRQQSDSPQQSIPEDTPARTPAADVREALREQLANLRLADKVKVRLVDTLGGAAGEYRAQIVTIAQDTPQGEVFTLNHEAIHVLRDLGLFNTSEWAILSAKARRETGLMRSIRQRYEAGFRQRGMTGAAMEEALIEEAVADMFARHQDGRYKAEGTTDRLFKMLRQFFEAVRNAFAGRGLRTAEGVMQDVADGRVGARNSQGMLDGSARQSRLDRPTVVYHGGTYNPNVGPNFPLFVSPDPAVSESYATDRGRGRGRLIEFEYTPRKVATAQDIDRIAKPIFGEQFSEQSTFSMLDPNIGGELSDKVLDQLDAEGFDAVEFKDFAMDSDFEEVPAMAILAPSAIGRGSYANDAFYSIPERDDLVALGGTEPTWKGKAADAFDRWRTAMQDRYLPLLKVQRQIEEQTGKPLPVSRNPYMGEELMTGRIGARLERLAEDHVQPLFDAMHAEKVTTEELESFLYARHAPERNARIAEINPEFTEGEGSGMTDLEAAAIMSRVRKAGKMEAMERLAKRVDQIRDDALDYRVQTGLISKEEADEWRSTYQFYVPLRGFKETGTDAIPERMNRSGGGINVRGRESKQAFGRRSQADSPLAYLILQAEEAIIRGETNIVAARFYNLAKANPDKEFWSINKPTVRQRMNEESGLVESYTTYNLLAEDKDWTVSAKINGREVRVTMNKENLDARRLADAMRNLTQHQLDWVTLHMGKVNRFLSAVNTSYNPEFIITNAFRDLQTATFNLSGESVKGIVRGTLKDYRKALAASTKGAFGKHSGEWGKWYDEFVMNGGRVYFNKVENVEEIKKRIASAAEMAKAKAGEGGPRLQAKRLFLAGRDMIENLNNGVENAVRLSVYKNAREAGLTPAQAASIAKNVTVNFNRRGTAGPAMNAAYLFFNASVQGSARILMALRSPRVRKMVAGVMIAAAAAEILNAMMSADDDDGESIYDKIPAFEKSRNIILMMPDGKSYIKIPMPYGYNAFWEAGRSAAEIARRGGDRWLETMGQFAGTVADAFNPIGGSDSLLNILSPTITDPIVDLTLNKDFTGKPIMPNQSPYGPEEPDNQRYFNSVGPHWRAITDFFNSATGGDEVMPGAVDVSPETLEYLAGTVVGSAGGFLDRIVNLTTKGFDDTEEVTANDIPLARKVVGGKPSWVDKASYYDRVKRVEQEVSYVEDYLDAGNSDDARSYAEKNRNILTLEGAAKQAKKDMRDVRKARREIETARERGQIDDATYRQKKEVIDRADKLVVTEFNTAWNQAMQSGE